MVLGKVKKLFKKALTITLAAAMVATSVPQLSVTASAQEVTVLEEGTDEGGSDSGDVSENDSGSGGEENTTNMAMRYIANVVAEDNWTKVLETDITGFSGVNSISSEYTVSYDIYLPKDVNFTESYYIKPALKLNDGKGTDTSPYNWVDGGDVNAKTITLSDFANDETTGLLKYSFSGKVAIADTTAYTDITSVAISIGSSDSCSYNGAIFIDNVAITDADSNVTTQNFTGYEGAVELGNMDGVSTGGSNENGDDNGGSGDVSGNDSGATSLADASLVFNTSTDTTWSDKSFATEDVIEDVTLNANLKLTATVTLDSDMSKLTDSNGLQLSCAVKIGDDWIYYKSQDYAWLQTDQFEENKATVTFTTFKNEKADELLAGGKIREIIFQYNVSTDAYTVSYKSNKKVGDTVKVTITGKGNFTGKVVNEEAKVVVSSKDNVTFTAADLYITKNSKVKNVKPKLTIVETATNKKLAAKTDYDKTIKYYSDEACTTGITDADVVADKVLYAQITLTSNYGSTTEQAVTMVAPFRLYTAKASSFKVPDMPKDITYTGKAIEPEFTVTVKEGNTYKTLTKGVDYTVTYTNNVKVGTAKATITGIGNGYGGSKTVTFKIKPQKLSASVFSILTDSVRELLAK